MGILESVRKMILEDDSLTDANNCREATIKIKKQLEKQFPKESINTLAYPEANEGLNVHYALSTNDYLINTVGAPMFPQFIGPKENVVPTMSLLKKVDKVK